MEDSLCRYGMVGLAMVKVKGNGVSVLWKCAIWKMD